MTRYHLKQEQHYQHEIQHTIRLLAVCVLMMVFPSLSAAAVVTHSVTHTFSIDDVQGGFDGSTYGGVEGSTPDPELICGDPFIPCPEDAQQPFQDKSGTWLYPVDSEFGFYVEDFVGAAQKTRDGDYAEGWVGDITSNGTVIGLKVSNAKTDTFKVTYPMGTWCAGLGGNTVKCSTEHFATLEHIKTCYETVPYFYATADGTQSKLYYPGTNVEIPGATCAEGILDNTLYVVENGVVSEDEEHLLKPDVDGNPDLIPNESSVRDDIAVGNDYSITKKDDGKALYRFGSLVKRPNDIRLYARMALPQEWKDNPETAYTVHKAELHVDHLITNNPNDQIRAEDMENEGATGRVPGYNRTPEGYWISNRNCYEGDGDYIVAGTIFKHPSFVLNPDNAETNPVPYSEDLQEGFTNAWFTTTDRDPFENEPDPERASGPRWRLKANKFGQDIPGLELPSVECMATPYTSEFIKYDVGAPTTTVINLLDFEEDHDADPPVLSPLLTSSGWISTLGNGVNELAPVYGDDGTIVDYIEGLSVNGLPLTKDFDLAVYIKGDVKPTAIYNARLIIEYEGDDIVTPPSGAEFDLAINSFKVPSKISGGDTRKFSTSISNSGPDIANGTLKLECLLVSINEVVESETIITEIGPVAPGETIKIVTPWTAPYLNEPVFWTATIVAEGDTEEANNTGEGTTLVRY